MNPVLADTPPPRLRADDHRRILDAATIAEQRYPGPVGELLARELRAFDFMGFRFGQGTVIARLVDDLLAPPAEPAELEPAPVVEPARTRLTELAARLRNLARVRPHTRTPR